MQTYFEAILAEKDKAIDAALSSAKELADKHNDLIHAAERRDALYVTKEQLDAAKTALWARTAVLVTGIGVVASIVIAVVLRIH